MFGIRKKVTSLFGKAVPDVVPTGVLPYGTGIRMERARTNAVEAVNGFQAVEAQVKATPVAGGKVSEELAKSMRTSSHELNVAAIEMRSARGSLLGSIQNLFVQMGEKLGVKTTFGGGTKTYSEKVLTDAAKGRVSLIERIVSKPIRIVANRPVLAMVATGVLAAVGIGNAMHKRAERRTEQQAMQEAAFAEQLAQQAPAAGAQANTTYQVTPEEWARAQSQFRGGQGASQTGHADAVMAARQQDQQATAGL